MLQFLFNGVDTTLQPEGMGPWESFLDGQRAKAEADREAERQACIHAFTDYGAHRIHAEIPATNRAAQKVVTFLGFEREGVMRRAIRRGDEVVDNEVWGLLPGEFKGWPTERS